MLICPKGVWGRGNPNYGEFGCVPGAGPIRGVLGELGRHALDAFKKPTFTCMMARAFSVPLPPISKLACPPPTPPCAQAVRLEEVILPLGCKGKLIVWPW